MIEILATVGDIVQRRIEGPGQSRAREEGGQLVLEFEAASWDDAKRRQNEFVSTIRARLPD